MESKAQNPLSNFLSSIGNMLIKLSGSTNHVEEDLSPAPEFKFSSKTPTTNGADPDSGLLKKEEDEKWFNRLSEIVSQFDLEVGISFGRRGEYIHVKQATSSTESMMQQLYSDFNELATAFNTTAGKEAKARVRLTVGDYVEKPRMSGKKAVIIASFKITTTSRQLVVIGKPAKVHFYIAPAKMTVSQEEAQARERRKLSFRLSNLQSGSSWTVCGLPVAKRDINYLERMLLRDLVILSSMDAVAAESGNKFEHVENLGRVSDDRGFRDTISLASEPTEDLVRDLLLAQQNAVHKLLNQQEEIQATIARDLHDSVLADILMLRRKVSSDQNLDAEQIQKTLDDLTQSIRDICSGLVPRDLKDWGLETVLQDLVDKVAEDTEADCSFDVDGTIPDLPSAVQLHIFRIVQECITNIKKYANAKSIVLSIVSKDNQLSFKIQDDGEGFDITKREHTDGGFGLPGIEERVEIIKAFYPTRLKIDSTLGEGTTVLLELVLSAPD